MSIEEELFNRYIVNKDKLLDIGFKLDNNIYTYSTNIMNNNFKVIIAYTDTFKGTIIDLNTNEEYTNFRNKTIGSFNQEIKDNFIKILTDIRDKSCIRVNYVYSQSNRINDYIYEKYKINPEFLFLPENHGVYRNKDKKWFSILMMVPYNKLDSNLNDKLVEVINVKIDKTKLDELLSIKGIYKAYHMNKKSWVSIVLDDTLKDKIIIELIDNSYKLVEK